MSNPTKVTHSAEAYQALPLSNFHYGDLVRLLGDSEKTLYLVADPDANDMLFADDAVLVDLRDGELVSMPEGTLAKHVYEATLSCFDR